MRGAVALIGVVACSAPSPKPSPPPPPPPPLWTQLVDAKLPSKDLCPDEPEDLDGFQDDDGCPDPDNDKDAIPDVKDRCPNEPETFNHHEDEDGCPDRDCVIERDFPFCERELLFFDRGSASPSTAKYGAILDAAAETMKHDAGDIQLVEVRGVRGADEPRAMSKKRAAAVVQLLVGRGVDAARFNVVDGGVRPANEGPNGWHRVELSITQQRVRIEDAEAIICTPMGRYFRKLTDEERAARCR